MSSFMIQNLLIKFVPNTDDDDDDDDDDDINLRPRDLPKGIGTC